MNKITKIKKFVTGSTVGMVVAGLLVAGIAGAATSIVLSGSVTAKANVSAPVEMSVNEGRNGSATGNTWIGVNTTGASTFEFTTVAKNNANNEVSGYPVIVIEETDEGKITGEEFTGVWFDDGSWNGEIVNRLYVVHSDGSLTRLKSKDWDNKKLVLFFDNDRNGNPQTYPIAAETVNWNVLKVTLDQSTVGNYKIRSQYVDDLGEYAKSVYGE